jgi:hypothetical protein
MPADRGDAAYTGAGVRKPSMNETAGSGRLGLALLHPRERLRALTLGAMPVAAGNGELTISCLMGKFRNGELGMRSATAGLRRGPDSARASPAVRADGPEA